MASFEVSLLVNDISPFLSDRLQKKKKKKKKKTVCKIPIIIIFQESIAYLPLIMLISATVSAGFSKQFVRRIGNKVLEYT